MLLRLPNEILDNIANSNAISEKDLSALSRVNSGLLQISRRILYRSTSIRLTPGPDAFLPAFLANSDIGSFITSFSFTCPFDPSACLPVYQHLARALRGMPNAVAVDLQVFPGASWILKDVQWPLLRSLRCSFHFDPHVATLLSHSVHLHSFEMSMSPHGRPGDYPPFSKRSCPSLAHFMGPPKVAALLVPGRPVERLHMLGMELTGAILDKLAASTRSVEVLEANVDPAHLPAVIAHLRSTMPRISFLRLASRIPVDLVSPFKV